MAPFIRVRLESVASTDEGILGQRTAGGVPLVEEVVDPAEQRPVTGEAVIGSKVDHRVTWQLAAALYLVVGLMTVVLVAAHVLRRVRQDAGADSQALIEIPVQPQLEVVLRQAWQIVTAGHANLVVRAAALAFGAVVLGQDAGPGAEGGVQEGVVHPPVEWPLLASQTQFDALTTGAAKVGEVAHATARADEQQVIMVHAAESPEVPAGAAGQFAAYTDLQRAGDNLLKEGVGRHGVWQAAWVCRVRAAQLDWCRGTVTLGKAAVDCDRRSQLPGKAQRGIEFAIGEVAI